MGDLSSGHLAAALDAALEGNLRFTDDDLPTGPQMRSALSVLIEMMKMVSLAHIDIDTIEKVIEATHELERNERLERERLG